MSSPVDKLAARRPHDAGASREALLGAADELFDERGYDGATVREIGERAGIDPALIARYFGGKEGLYLAALRERGAALPKDSLEVVSRMLSHSDERGSGPVGRAIVSATLSEDVRAQVTALIAERMSAPLAAPLAATGVDDAALRIEILVAMAVGVALARAGGTLPELAEASVDEVVAVLTPLVAALEAGTR